VVIESFRQGVDTQAGKMGEAVFISSTVLARYF
jgi:hypothetical protein